MGRISSFAWIGILAAAGMHGEIIDRIAVTVGQHVIAESEILRDLRVSAMIDQKPVDESPEQKRKDADRLVEQILILQEAEFTRVTAPSAGEVAKLVEQVKMSYGSDYDAALARYRITEADLSEHLALGLRAMRFADLRFRPEVQVTEDDLRDFYSQLVTEAQRNKTPPPGPFEESREQVESLMIEQGITQALDRWLGEQRTQVEILFREAAFK